MSKCLSCLHYKVCDYRINEENITVAECTQFTNRSEWVHLPCKAGDTVYYTSGKYYNDIIKCRVVAIEQNEKGMIIKTQLWHQLPNIPLLHRLDKWFGKDDFFKIVFPTREEAEKALDKKKGVNKNDK